MTTDFRLYLLTWNVGETFPPKDLTRLLGLNGKSLPNLYAIGLQEMKSSTASRVSDLVFEDVWTSAITDCLGARNYVRIKMRRLMGIHISVYVRRIDLPYITNVESECTKTGLKGFWGNKGALSVRLDAFGVNICIINAHFTAHCENFRQRLEDYNLALESQRFRDRNSETILDHDYVFWMGDLNFRIEGTSNEEVRKRAAGKDFEYLLKYDQLTSAIRDELIFLDFFEGPLRFPPTFKFDVGTDVYDTSAKNRVPSYCDRVLWRVHEDSYEGVDLSVEQLSYDCVMDEKSSDHKPVFSEFTIQVLKSPPELPVMFEPMGSWCQHKDNEVSYLVSSSLPLNSRDWIGLYREGYKNWLDYVTYVWSSVKGEDMHDGSHMHTVSFESRYLQRLPSDTFFLLYFSFLKNCVVGYSDGFRLVMTEESSVSSSEVEMEDENGDLKPDEEDNIDDFLSNRSFNNSNYPVDQVDAEPPQNAVQPSDEEGQGSEEDEEPRQRYSLLEHVEPDRSMMKQREPVIKGECESEEKVESPPLMVFESEQEALTELKEVDELGQLVPGRIKEPVFGEGGKTGLGEPPLSLITESDEPLLGEPAKPLITESEKPLITESEKPLLSRPEKPLLSGPAKSLITEPEKPLLSEPAKPLIAESEKPSITEPEMPLLCGPAKPLITESEKPLITQPEKPLLGEPAKPLITESEKPLITASLLCELDKPFLDDLDHLKQPELNESKNSSRNEPKELILDKVELVEQSFVAETEEPIPAEPGKLVLDEQTNLIHSSSGPRMFTGPQKPVLGELGPEKLSTPEPEHQVLTEIAPVLAEVKEQSTERPDQPRIRMDDPILEGSLLKDLQQPSLNSEQQLEEFEEHETARQSLLGNLDQLRMARQSELTESEQVTDKTELLTTGTEHEKSAHAEPVRNVLTDRLSSAQRTHLDEPVAEEFARSDEPHEPKQCGVGQPEQTPVALPKTAEAVPDANLGASNQLANVEQSTSDGAASETSGLPDNPAVDARKPVH